MKVKELIHVLNDPNINQDSEIEVVIGAQENTNNKDLYISSSKIMGIVELDKDIKRWALLTERMGHELIENDKRKGKLKIVK